MLFCSLGAVAPKSAPVRGRCRMLAPCPEQRDVVRGLDWRIRTASGTLALSLAANIERLRSARICGPLAKQVLVALEDIGGCVGKNGGGLLGPAPPHPRPSGVHGTYVVWPGMGGRVIKILTS